MASLVRNGTRFLDKIGLVPGLRALTPFSNGTHQTQQRRKLSLHEHLSMGLLTDAGVPVPRYRVANNPEEARLCAKELEDLTGPFSLTSA